MTKRPYDDHGRFVPLDCPNRGCDGKIHFEGDRDFSIWQCHGLVDPGTTDKELQPCEFSHIDGDPYTRLSTAQATP